MSEVQPLQMSEEKFLALKQEAIKLKRILRKQEGIYYTRHLYDFNTKILQINGKDNERPLAPAHQEMCEFIDKDKKKWKLLLFPRGHLKSTLVTVGRSLQAIAKNPK